MPRHSSRSMYYPDETLPGKGRPSEPPASIKFRNIIWPVLLSLTVLGFIGYLTFEPASFGQALQSLNLFWMAMALVTVVLRIGFGAWRISFISRGELNWRQGLRGQLAWDFFSNVTPAAFGGGPFAAIYISRNSSIRVGESTALILFAMLLDQLWTALLIPFLFVCSFYIAVLPESLGTLGNYAFWGYFLLMLVWIGIFGYATLLKPDHIRRFSDKLFRLRFLRRFQDRVSGEMEQMSASAHQLRKQRPSYFGKCFLLTAGTWLPRYLLPLFLVLSFFPDVESFLLFVRGIAMMLSSMIMPTPGAAGGIEGFYALLLGPLMPSMFVAPTLFLWRFLAFYLFIALGVLLFMRGKSGKGFDTKAPVDDRPKRDLTPSVSSSVEDYLSPEETAYDTEPTSN